MLFTQAIEQLKASIPMYRTGWEPQDGYVALMPGMGHVWKIVLTPAPNAGNYMFSVEDFLASDWEVYQLHKAPISVVEASVEEMAA